MAQVSNDISLARAILLAHGGNLSVPLNSDGRFILRILLPCRGEIYEGKSADV